MINARIAARKLYGDVFLTVFEDGTEVPWKLLSTENFLKYDYLTKVQEYPFTVYEDEIFELTVLDKSLIDNIHNLKAGIVSTVAMYIMQYSGPQNIDDVNMLLELKRHEVQHVLHNVVMWIIKAFPAYTPDDLYKLDYSELTQRLALAETSLLSFGVITEPLCFTPLNTEEQPQPTAKPVEVAPKPKVNLQQKFQEQQQTIISKDDMQEAAAAMGDTENWDQIANETAQLYPEYLKQMQEGKAVTIPSTEERVAAAEKRQELNKQRLEKAKQNQVLLNKQELEHLQQVKKQAQKRKARKKQRR